MEAASILGFNFLKFEFGGMTPFSRTRIVLIKPAKPAPPSRWPMLDFKAPLELIISYISWQDMAYGKVMSHGKICLI